jgi:hypothetical protein
MLASLDTSIQEFFLAIESIDVAMPLEVPELVKIFSNCSIADDVYCLASESALDIEQLLRFWQFKFLGVV